MEHSREREAPSQMIVWEAQLHKANLEVERRPIAVQKGQAFHAKSQVEMGSSNFGFFGNRVFQH